MGFEWALELLPEKFYLLCKIIRMKSFEPQSIPIGQLFAFLTSAVTPRPIAFASTIDNAGNVNLSPFSFFNVFGANPVTFVFSPSRKVRDNTTKHTLENILEVPEVVINMVNFDMVQQVSLASTEYDKGVNEFIKSGFTPISSEKIKPPRVKESPIAFECIVKQVIATGDGGGSGNLVICEAVMIHCSEAILDEKGEVDPFKLDAVSRLGKNWYGRVNEASIFEVEKPLVTKGIGVDAIPAHIKNSNILTGNDLGKLGNIEELPTFIEIEAYFKQNNSQELSKEINRHLLAHQLLSENKVRDAWKVLLYPMS
jgi:flavin reductase (DIM6/NTAB) family NADH-FMN oxidoreductase RutF